ncbi:MAG: thioredoxin [Calditrichaeota bacterium]|nr:thioredoxin [Calditrichota bacterium]
MSKPLEFNASNFEAEVLKSDQPVLVDFWAAWCGPCLRLAPTIEALAQKYDGQVKIGKVDVDSNQMLAQQFNIRGIPAMLIFKNGKVVDTLVGAQPQPMIEKQLQAAL